jgi:hypothetical protein
VGDPEQVADALTGWVAETDVDGFNLSRTVMPECLEDFIALMDFIALVVPRLQDREMYKREYREGTLSGEVVRVIAFVPNPLVAALVWISLRPMRPPAPAIAARMLVWILFLRAFAHCVTAEILVWELHAHAYPQSGQHRMHWLMQLRWLRTMHWLLFSAKAPTHTIVARSAHMSVQCWPLQVAPQGTTLVVGLG